MQLDLTVQAWEQTIVPCGSLCGEILSQVPNKLVMSGLPKWL